ncbi:unnamed protein product [Effrenium voratum]|uniref:DNA2/NAM7 helicase helicase domain-containing protein n=1 Tax=Effrenium voratum TaxID=2562239 RepID=A0AA36MXX9_9DINO|nr:unnamed protein product [Effrenium voratum]
MHRKHPGERCLPMDRSLRPGTVDVLPRWRRWRGDGLWPDRVGEKEGLLQRGQDFDLEVELSEKIGHLIREAQQGAVLAATDFQLQLIAVPANEKKAVELLRTIPEKPPLGALRLQEPSARGARVEAEAKPLASRQQVEAVLRRPAFPSASALNGEQLLAVQRGLQRPFSTVQGPPGTGKTSFLVSLIASTLSLELHSQMKHREPPRLLVLAPSNHAVDEIVRRLVRDTEIPGHYVRPASTPAPLRILTATASRAAPSFGTTSST